MPTVFSHAFVGFASAKLANEVTSASRPVLIAAMTLSALPDADALFISVIPYNHPLGHRGFTHSIVFAIFTGVTAAALFSKMDWANQRSFRWLAVFFVLVTASHGFLDAITDGGLGIAFFAPFNNARYFLPWRPIPVAPLSLNGLMTPRGLRVFGWEAALLWTLALGAVIWDGQTTWRRIVAGACVLVGTVMWVIALNQN